MILTPSINHSSGITYALSNLTREHITHYVKNSVMLYSSSIDFAYDYGGTLTKMFLAKLLSFPYWNNIKDKVVIDSRVHMLMNGFYPAIPGWHLDGVYRTEVSPGVFQPDIESLNYRNPKHVTMFVDDCVNPQLASRTEFLAKPVEVGDYVDPLNVYKSFHNHIEKSVKGCMIPFSGDFVEFDSKTFHRATPSKSKDLTWRFFIRASEYGTIRDEIRQNTQTYILSEENGW